MGPVKMEEIKPLTLSSNLISDGGGMEARLLEFCKMGLLLDENTTTQAMSLFRESKHLLLANMSALGSGTPEETERFWFAFVLFIVKKLGPAKNTHEKIESGFTLSQILRVAKLNAVDFFKEMPQFFLKAGLILTNLYGSDWEKRLQAKELQANFVHLAVLSKYYKRTYLEFFLPSDPNDMKQSVVAIGAEPISDYLRFGWLLFLALRIHAFSPFKDVVTCTNGLVSILAILIIHMPVRLRNFSLSDSQRFVRKADKGVDLIATLSNIYQTSEDDLRKTVQKATNLIVHILKKKPHSVSESKPENLKDIDTDSFTYFEGLMEEEYLASSIQILDKDYEDAICDRDDFDERGFIHEDDSLFGTGSLSGGAINLSGCKRKYDCLASPTKTITSPASPPGSPSASPMNGSSANANFKIPSTPVSTTMTTAKWLRTVVAPLPPSPSPELEHFLSLCDKDVTNDVMRRALIILEAIFPSAPYGDRCGLQSATLMDTVWAEQRRMEALKLYFRVLLAMCRAESQILHNNNLTSLLTNERFHRCMLACSAELVLATHKTVTMMFPAVLERTGITAFDLSKVIESFVRHEETLPRELKRHLNSLEERLLESMAWEKGSSMYNSLIVAKPSLAAEINRLGLLADPMPSLDTIALHHSISSGGSQTLPALHKHETSPDKYSVVMSPKRVSTEAVGVLGERNSFTSPVKERLLAFNCFKSKLQPPLQSAFASPTRPSPGGGGETCAETGISIFFRKVLKLAAIRIKSLCERLQQPNNVMESVYSLVQQIINRQTVLFFNRHIDQIILCSFYGVSKIFHLNLTFREIIFNYRKQPQCKPQVFRSVFVDWPSTSRNGKAGQEHVDIIRFYNELFILAVKPLLVELGPAGVAAKTIRMPEENNKADGQPPGSPRLSPFTSLPDMSPKKVSATHNIYVSPLRSSKMETLISHNSKSYYACVGESTHAYQSPSKDLTVINNRLNSTRKVNARLNFDEAGLVSDSLVAGSLYPPQNGGSIAASDSSVLSSPMKRKLADR
ncbi:retinoblastoma-related protein [Amborella trichopoda]|uniref:Retinoblastoma-related protein n=1 Tax=Amborella trichopoda TaxID=13333 RepID=W1PFC3_AMBTC|nr:retinoblastoma-related protein [Amborella trichopoda]ERN06336.1 hypothetical protein AMTR_s00016p00239570 [Amborella trichopoda]|eukprot:XP_006844661.1 retinoblastoma-related protein [Amborella trichopoda]